jgi:hypothetical protein
VKEHEELEKFLKKHKEFLKEYNKPTILDLIECPQQSIWLYPKPAKLLEALEPGYNLSIEQNRSCSFIKATKAEASDPNGKLIKYPKDFNEYYQYYIEAENFYQFIEKCSPGVKFMVFMEIDNSKIGETPKFKLAGLKEM